MNTPSESPETSAGCDDPIDEIRRIFEIAVALDSDRRESWLIENVPNSATRHVVARLLAADARPGFLDFSVMQLLDAICLPSAQHAASARRVP